MRSTSSTIYKSHLTVWPLGKSWVTLRFPWDKQQADPKLSLSCSKMFKAPSTTWCNVWSTGQADAIGPFSLIWLCDLESSKVSFHQNQACSKWSLKVPFILTQHIELGSIFWWISDFTRFKSAQLETWQFPKMTPRIARCCKATADTNLYSE